jgi:hypothetical protein
MAGDSMRGTLHVTNGDSVQIRDTGLEGEVLTWKDALHEGPVPGGLTLDELRPVRAHYLASLDHLAERAIIGDLERRDRTLAEFRERSEVVLWFEHDLYDQLQLLQILDWFSHQDRGGTRLSLISTDTYLGALRPERLLPLYSMRQEVTAAQLHMASRAWSAFCAPDPRGLVPFSLHAVPELPYLPGALQRHLEEFPAVESGLSRTQRQILENLEGGASSAAALFIACQKREERIFMGDLIFFSFLRRMASIPVPLLRLADTPGDRAAFGRSQAEITPHGSAVLHDAADHVLLNGIDRWLGGVHLHCQPGGPQNAVWRWNTQERRFEA